MKERRLDKADKTNKIKKAKGTYLALAFFTGAQQNVHGNEHPDADPLPRQALLSACFTSCYRCHAGVPLGSLSLIYAFHMCRLSSGQSANMVSAGWTPASAPPSPSLHPHTPHHQEADDERVIATVPLIFSFMCIQEKMNFVNGGL